MKKFINITTVIVILSMLATMTCGCSEKESNEEIIDESIVSEAVETEAAIAPTIVSTTATEAVATEAAATEATAAATEATTIEATTTETEATTTAADAGTSDAITDEMALDAVHNRCVLENPENVDLGGDHWTVESSNDSQIVVLFLAYTGAEIRYYVDRASGDTHVTEFVSGIHDEEQDSDETFNVREYITAEIYR